MQLTQKNLMKTAWQISRDLSGVYGGKAREFVGGVMKDLNAVLNGKMDLDTMIAQYNEKPASLTSLTIEEPINEWSEAVLATIEEMVEYWGSAGQHTSRYTLTMLRCYQILLNEIKTIGMTTFNRILQIEVSGELLYTHIMREMEKMDIYYDDSYAGRAEDVVSNILAWIERGLRDIGVGDRGIQRNKRKAADMASSIMENTSLTPEDAEQRKNIEKKQKMILTDTAKLYRELVGE